MKAYDNVPCRCGHGAHEHAGTFAPTHCTHRGCGCKYFRPRREPRK